MAAVARFIEGRDLRDVVLVGHSFGGSRRGERRPGALPAGAWHPGMSRRLGAFKLVEMGGSHEVMFTRPAELARKLVEASND